MRALHVLLAVSLLLQPGCAAWLERSSGSMVSGGLAALGEEENQELLFALLAAPEAEQAAQRLALAAVEGAREGMSDEAWDAVLQERSEALVDALMPVVAESLEAEIGPAARAEVVQAVRDAVAELSRPETQAVAGDFASSVAVAMVDALGPRLGEVAPELLQQDVGPALEVWLRQAAEGDDSAFRPVGQQVFLGLGDAMQGDLGEEIDGMLDRHFASMGEDVEAAVRPWRAGLFVVGAGLSLFLLVAVGLWFRQLRQADRMQRALELVTGVIKRSEERPEVRDLVKQVKATGTVTPGGRELRRFLRDRPDLKVHITSEEA